jgi:hypothetical protein
MPLLKVDRRLVFYEKLPDSVITIRFQFYFLELMALLKPSIFSTSNGDGCVFLTWPSIINATHYEIKLEINSTGEKTIYCTTSSSFLITKLENERFYSVQVTALNKTERSESSIGIMVRPKLRPSLSKLSATPADQPGRIRLKWTSTSTDFGFHVERCDIGGSIGYKRIAWASDNTITTCEDQTDCDLSEGACPGHYYTVRFRDSAWSCGAGVLSKKVFCMSSINSKSDIEPEKADLFEDNPSETSETSSTFTSDAQFDLTSSE